MGDSSYTIKNFFPCYYYKKALYKTKNAEKCDGPPANSEAYGQEQPDKFECFPRLAVGKILLAGKLRMGWEYLLGGLSEEFYLRKLPYRIAQVLRPQSSSRDVQKPWD
jgi:hypothetical protein